MSASMPRSMESEKEGVKRAMAQEAGFRDEKQRIVASLGGSPAELVSPSADDRIQRKLGRNSNNNNNTPSSSTAVSSLVSREGSARGFQQANDAPEESPPDDELPRALDHSEEHEEQQHREPRFKKKTCYITVAVILLVVAGGFVGGVFALVSRGGASSPSNAGSDAESEMCQLDLVLAQCEKNCVLAVPDCAADTYLDLANAYPDLVGGVEDNCDAAHLGLVALAVSQTNHDNVDDPILFFAMSTLFFALKGEEWRMNTNWLKGTSPCSWSGVICSGDGATIDLSLDNNLLQGSLPTELGLLSNLRDLSIGLNQISGSIPSEIGRLKKLKTFDFRLTSIHSELPSEIGMLTELREFVSQSVPLTGTIPSEIGNMSNLEYLEFTGNQVTGTLPSELGNLVELRTFALVFLSGITGTVPLELIALTRLQELHLEQLGALDPFPFPEVVGLATNLTHISIRSSHVTGSLPTIDHLSKLDELHLRELFMTGTVPTELGLLSKLDVLSLERSSLQGTLPSEVGLLTNLRRMNVWIEPRISGGLPSELGSLTALELLNLSDTGMDGTIPEEVCALNVPPLVFLFDNCAETSDLILANGCFVNTCGS